MPRVDDQVVRALGIISSGWVDVNAVGHQLLGRPLTKREAWEIGSRMASQWKAQTGLAHPPFTLLPKRFGQGTHLKAVYPPEWVGEIEKLVTLCVEKQGVANGFPVLPDVPFDPEGYSEGSLFDLFGPEQSTG